jgi:DNA-binding transcriptional LysR family regulator
MLNVYELNVFPVAAETQNFSEAARQLHLSQPTVSQQIQLLERHVGAQLFQRTGRTVSLTEAGLVLVPLAREMVHLSLDQLNVVMELGNAEAIEMAVEEGIGVAFVSRLAARRGLELGRIKEVQEVEAAMPELEAGVLGELRAWGTCV